MAAPKIPVTISYHTPGTKPPLFVAGTFSDPQWEPMEMEYDTSEAGELVFKKIVSAEPGTEIQYKFRVGTGEWWVLSENTPTVTDDAGNCNHVLRVSLSNRAAAESSPTFRPGAESVPSKEDPDVKAEYSNSSPSAAGPPKLLGAATVLPRSIKVEDEEKPDLNQFPLKAESQKMAEMAPSADDSLPSIKAEDSSMQMADHVRSVPVKIQDTKYLPVANAAKELLSRSDPRSGASTPGFVRTTAEVADTAALLDREESEPEMSDAEAGKIGYRRLSSTPIPEVARTAAEVADTAEKLDNVEPDIQLELRPTAYFYVDDEEDVHGDHKPPLFSHECAGMDEDEAGNLSDPNDNPDHARSGSFVDYDLDDADLNDPTLEAFPSGRDDILNTVRRIETGLGEDQSAFECAALSPVVGLQRRGSNDILGDYFVVSPTATSPVVTRSQERLRVPRSPQGSVSSMSLQSIRETDESDALPERDSLRAFQLNAANLPPMTWKIPDSDEDEGVVLSLGDKGKNKGFADAKSPDLVIIPRAAAASSSSAAQPAPETHAGFLPEFSNQTAPLATLVTDVHKSGGQNERPATPKTILQGSNRSSSPRIVFQPAEEGREAPSQISRTNAEDVPSEPITTDTPGASANARLRKRTIAGSRPGTPASIRSTHLAVDRQGWFKAFFRVFFDWISSFARKLCGGGSDS